MPKSWLQKLREYLPYYNNPIDYRYRPTMQDLWIYGKRGNENWSPYVYNGEPIVLPGYDNPIDARQSATLQDRWIYGQRPTQTTTGSPMSYQGSTPQINYMAAIPNQGYAPGFAYQPQPVYNPNVFDVRPQGGLYGGMGVQQQKNLRETAYWNPERAIYEFSPGSYGGWRWNPKIGGYEFTQNNPAEGTGGRNAYGQPAGTIAPYGQTMRRRGFAHFGGPDVLIDPNDPSKGGKSYSRQEYRNPNRGAFNSARYARRAKRINPNKKEKGEGIQSASSGSLVNWSI